MCVHHMELPKEESMCRRIHLLRPHEDQEVHTPTIVTTMTKPIVVQNNVRGLRIRYNPYHISNAAKAAAVPGANGISPVYSPVERIS